jgi:chromosome segregation ATPase
MNSIDAFQKRLRDETTTVEKEIQSHNQQVEALSKRLEGLKRAAELFESEQAAIVELLQTGTANGSGIPGEMSAAPTATMQKAAASAKATAARKQVGRNAQIARSKTKTGPNTRAASQNGGLTRVDMIAAVLRRHPRRTVRELIVLLDQEYRWKTTESAVTGHLYTRRDKFVHTQPDHATNRPVTWSSR